MKSFFKLAWRNLWRNRRRTLITLTSVTMAVLLAVAISSLQEGVYDNMISNAVRFSTGYIQVHAKGYWDDKSINNSFTPSPAFDSVLRSESSISLAVPRLESFALASSGPHTKGVAVWGIDPVKENNMHVIADRMVAGKYLSATGDSGVLMGDALAQYLRLGVGDTLVMLGQGYHGSTAAGQFVVRGLFHYPVDELNNSMVYLSLPAAQQLFAAANRLSSMSLILTTPGNRKILAITQRLQQRLGADWEVMPWQDMNRELVQQISGDRSGGLVMLGILYLVVAFGVFGTILMMTVERKKEFAVMIAIGMHRSWITFVVFLETCLIGALGILCGILLILPILWYVHLHPIALTGSTAETYQQFGIEPIIPASLDPVIFLYQGLIVLAMALASSVYPLIYVGRLPLTPTLKQ